MAEKKEKIVKDGKKKMKPVIIIIIMLLAVVVLSVIIAKSITNIFDKEELVVMWEEPSVEMDVGEVREINWISSKVIKPKITGTGRCVAIVSTNEQGISVRALESGTELITMEIEGQELILVITVNEETFTFLAGYSEVRILEEKVFNIRKEPESAFFGEDVRYGIADWSVAQIVDFDNGGVRVLGLQEGVTVLEAYWRNKRTSMELWITDRAERNIIVPYGSRFMNVGQETVLEVFMDDMIRGDEYEFVFEPESGKEMLRVTQEDNKLTVRAVRQGEQYIQITHPRADNMAVVFFEILPAPVPPAPAIDVSHSPLIMKVDTTERLGVYLLNSGADSSLFTFEIVEGEYAVEAVKSGSGLTVKGIMPGVAKIRLRHPGIREDYDAMVIVDDMEGFYKFDPMRGY